MMDELRRAMLDAGAPRDEWQAELPFLIEAGQKRVRRRRMIATGIAAAVVTVIGTTAALAGIPGLNKADPDPVKDRHSGVYVEERLAPAEVERRCNVVLNVNRPKPLEWVAGVDAGSRAVPAEESMEPVETRVGWTVKLTPRGEVADANTSTEDSSGTLPGGGGGPDSQTRFCTIPPRGTLGRPIDRRAAPDGGSDRRDPRAMLDDRPVRLRRLAGRHRTRFRGLVERCVDVGERVRRGLHSRQRGR